MLLCLRCICCNEFTLREYCVETGKFVEDEIDDFYILDGGRIFCLLCLIQNFDGLFEE